MTDFACYVADVNDLVHNIIVSLPLQVAYVTAVFPYIVLIILFFRGVTLEGAGTGVEYLFKPDVRYIIIYGSMGRSKTSWRYYVYHSNHKFTLFVLLTPIYSCFTTPRVNNKD